jgi:hypothetical protein
MKIEEWYTSRKIALFNDSEAKQHLNSDNYKGETVESALKLLCLQYHLVQIPGLNRTDDYLVHPWIVHPSNLPEQFKVNFQTLLMQQFNIAPVPVYDLMTMSNQYPTVY